MSIHSIYGYFGRRFRIQRMRKFAVEFGIKNQQILDVGGTPFNWSLIQENDIDVWFVNLTPSKNSPNWSVANGCFLPFVDKSFDIVYSNSVIEHLGSLENQQKFAAECRRVGVRYYVQTPNKWFFIEPHLLAPFIHWLPRNWQVMLIRNFTIRGLMLRPSKQECQQLLDEIRLLDEQEMRVLFPDAVIWREKFLGLTKSFIAVKV